MTLNLENSERLSGKLLPGTLTAQIAYAQVL
jgi:hypothetical protein